MLRTSLWVTCSLVAIILASAGCSPPPPVEPESIKEARPVYGDYYLALPTAPLPEFPAQVGRGFTRITPITLTLEIGRNGRVKRVDQVDSVIPDSWNEIKAALKQLVFYPGRRGEQLVKQILPATLIMGPHSYQQKLLLPVDSSGEVLDSDLYWKGMEANSIELPAISQFPSYFLDIDLKDTSTDLNYLLARVDVNASGRVIAYETLHSDAGSFTAQIMEAINWGAYRLPEMKADSTVSFFLRIALYNLVPYPTIKLGFPVDSLFLHERERVKLLPDSTGLLFKPMPTRYQQDGLYSILGGRLTMADTLDVMISISTSGRVTSFNPPGIKGERLAIYLELANWMRFYPARDFYGKARPFTGIARLMYHASTKVRIQFLWLPGQGGSY